MTAVMVFACSICGESSEEICVYCTKDTCANHFCERCKRCSDCCLCESPIIRDKRAQEPAQEAGNTATVEEELEEASV
jgi:hypothetical protein